MKKLFAACGLLLALPFTSPIANFGTSHAMAGDAPVIQEKLLASVAEGDIKVVTEPDKSLMFPSYVTILMGDVPVAKAAVFCRYNDVSLDFFVKNKPEQCFSVSTNRNSANKLIMRAYSYRNNEDGKKSFEIDDVPYEFPFEVDLAPYFCDKDKLMSPQAIAEGATKFYNKYSMLIQRYSIQTRFPQQSGSATP